MSYWLWAIVTIKNSNTRNNTLVKWVKRILTRKTMAMIQLSCTGTIKNMGTTVPQKVTAPETQSTHGVRSACPNRISLTDYTITVSWTTCRLPKTAQHLKTMCTAECQGMSIHLFENTCSSLGSGSKTKYMYATAPQLLFEEIHCPLVCRTVCDSHNTTRRTTDKET